MDEEELLEQLRQCKDELNYPYQMSPDSLDVIVDKMIDLLRKLAEITPEDQLSEDNKRITQRRHYYAVVGALDHTKDREGNYYRDYYTQSSKGKLPAKKEKEVEASYKKYIQHIRDDINRVLNK